MIDDLYPDKEPGEWVSGLGDERIRYIRNEQNLGVSGNFQKSVDLATGDLVVIMGCDDALLPDYVRRVKQLSEMFPQASYIQPGVVVIGDDGAPKSGLADRVKELYRFSIDGPTYFDGEKLARSLLRGNWTYFPSIAWRTDVIRRHGFRTDLDVTLDLALQLAIISEGGGLVLDMVPTFQYRRHSASVSSWKAVDGSRFREESALFAETAERMRARGWARAARAARFHVSSRLNAVSQIPAALRIRDKAGLRALVTHAVK